MALDLSGWLPNLLPVLIKVAGVAQTARRYVNFVGITATDDSANDQLTITVTPAVTASPTFTGTMTLGALVVGSTDIATTGTVNDLALVAGATLYRFTGNIVLTGIAAGTHGQIIVITNIASAGLTLNHADAASAAANRFVDPSSGNLVLGNYASGILMYDSSVARWKCIGKYA